MRGHLELTKKSEYGLNIRQKSMLSRLNSEML